jgi:antitoxin (DNA-binding transcriptional repressor) of toxin-antitoxin stability system
MLRTRCRISSRNRLSRTRTLHLGSILTFMPCIQPRNPMGCYQAIEALMPFLVYGRADRKMSYWFTRDKPRVGSSALIDGLKRGSPVLIVDRGRPVAHLEPVTMARRRRTERPGGRALLPSSVRCPRPRPKRDTSIAAALLGPGLPSRGRRTGPLNSVTRATWHFRHSPAENALRPIADLDLVSRAPEHS